MIGRAAALAAFLALAAPAQLARAQGGPGAAEQIVHDGRGESARLLDAALARPHVVRAAVDGRAALPRDSTFASGVIVVGGTATVASRVEGDVVVVGGDLFLHPGADIAGDAVAIGGCVYNSTLATVRGARRCVRDATYRVGRAADGAITLAYEELRSVDGGWYALPGVYGFQPPAYDRVNGLSLGWGPALTLAARRVQLDPRATYRSDLGEVDPSAELRVRVGGGFAVVAGAARGSYSNEGWIRSDFVNAIGAFAFGTDARNYYRADRVEGRVVRTVDLSGGAVDFFAGARGEDARSVNPDSTSRSAPYSVFGRRDREEGMLRPNPPVTDGRIASGLVGASGEFQYADVASLASFLLEVPFDAPGGGRFVQATLDVATSFLAFGRHTVLAGAHGVATRGDPTPRQRFAYLGGSGTLPTAPLLTAGGDELLFVDGLYLVPLDRLRLPLVGAPAIGVRYAAGSVGVRELPRFTQNVGLRVTVSRARLDVLVDPATREANVSIGFAAAR